MSTNLSGKDGGRKSVPSHPHNCVDCGAGVHKETILHGPQYMEDKITVALCAKCIQSSKKRCYTCGVGEQHPPHIKYHFVENKDFLPIWTYICQGCFAHVREGKCSTVADEFLCEYYSYEFSLCDKNSRHTDIPCCGGHKKCNECGARCCEHESHSPWSKTGLCDVCDEERVEKEKIYQQDLDEKFAALWAEATVDFENGHCSGWDATQVF